MEKQRRQKNWRVWVEEACHSRLWQEFTGRWRGVVMVFEWKGWVSECEVLYHPTFPYPFFTSIKMGTNNLSMQIIALGQGEAGLWERETSVRGEEKLWEAFFFSWVLAFDCSSSSSSFPLTHCLALLPLLLPSVWHLPFVWLLSPLAFLGSLGVGRGREDCSFLLPAAGGNDGTCDCRGFICK